MKTLDLRRIKDQIWKFEGNYGPGYTAEIWNDGKGLIPELYTAFCHPEDRRDRHLSDEYIERRLRYMEDIRQELNVDIARITFDPTFSRVFLQERSHMLPKLVSEDLESMATGLEKETGLPTTFIRCSWTIPEERGRERK